MTQSPERPSRGPLQGLRVVEMEGLGPCPLAGQILADLGAEVIVITRKSAPADKTDINNRNKSSVALNLKHPEGLRAAHAVIKTADILIEGFRPGVMERIGLGPDDCHGENPRLIFGRMTGWGQTGPMSQMAGHDINYLGLTGVLQALGPSDAPPPPPLNIAADYGGGTMFLLLGVLAALFERQTSGKGQVIDAAMVDGPPVLMGLIHSMIARGDWSETRNANMLDGGAPFYRSYACADGKHIAVGPLEPQFFAQLVAKAGLPSEHCKDQYDIASWAARRDSYAEIFASKTRAEWEAIFDGTDACVTPILGWSEAARHPHMQARETLKEIDGVMQAMPAPRFDRTPAATPAPAPAPGAQTDVVLQQLGYDDTQLAALRAAGALT